MKSPLAAIRASAELLERPMPDADAARSPRAAAAAHPTIWSDHPSTTSPITARTAYFMEHHRLKCVYRRAVPHIATLTPGGRFR